MANARYWRLVSVRSVSGGDLTLFELALSGPSGRISAAVSCTVSPAAGAVANLNDADGSTTCTFGAASLRSGGFALSWDCASSVAVTGIVVGASNAAEWLRDARLEYLSSGAWTEAGTIAFTNWPGAGVVYTNNLFGYGRGRFVFGFDGPTPDSGAPSPLSVYGSGVSCTDTPAKWTRALKTTGSGHIELTNVLNLTLASGPDFSALGARDFVIASWFYVNGSDKHMFYSHGGAGSSQGADGNYRQGLLFGHGVRAAGKCTIWAGNLNLYGASKFIGLETAGLSLSNGWHYAALNCFGNSLALYIDGSLKPLSPFSGSFPNTDISVCRLYVDANINVQAEAWQNGANDGRHSDSNAARYIGSIDDLCVQIGGDPITSVPTGPLASIPVMELPMDVGHQTGSALAFSAAVPPAHVRSIRPSLLARDMEFGGAGTITGQTLVKDGGPEVPARARVRLLRARDGLLARETWSDPATGAYSFAGLDTGQQFVALAQKPDGAYEPVAGGPLTPQVP